MLGPYNSCLLTCSDCVLGRESASMPVLYRMKWQIAGFGTWLLFVYQFTWDQWAHLEGGKVFFWEGGGGGRSLGWQWWVRYQGGGAIASAWHQAFEYAIYMVLLLFTVLLCSNGLNSLLTVLVVPSMKFQREHIVENRYWIFYLTRRLMLTGSVVKGQCTLQNHPPLWLTSTHWNIPMT